MWGQSKWEQARVTLAAMFLTQLRTHPHPLSLSYTCLLEANAAGGATHSPRTKPEVYVPSLGE